MYFNLRLWGLTKGVRARIAIAVSIGLATTAAGIARLALLGVILARVFQGESLSSLVPLAGAAAGAVLLRAFLQYHKEMVAHRTAAVVQMRLREKLYGKVMELGPAYFNQQRTGDVMLSLVDGVEQLETFFGQYLPQLFIALLAPVGIFVYLLFLDLPIAGLILGFALLTLAAPALFHRWNEASSRRRREAYGDFGAEFLDSIQGLATLKAFGQSGARSLVLAERARAVFRSTMWVLATNAGSGGVTIAGIALGAATALGLGAARVSSGAMSLEALLVILMLGIEVFRPFRELSQLFHQGMNGLSAAAGVFQIFDATPLVSEGAHRPQQGAGGSARVAFMGVTFGYPGSRRPALRGLTFEARPGERLGIVGESGAGKSTIVKLLLRFYDPDSGVVNVGGWDAREMRLHDMRRQIALVAQDTYLFHGTVAENLRFGGPEATRDQMERAARVGNAHEFISRLPRGYDTVIGERGIRLSGGQRQRIAIARALLRDAPILVLDEALSSVDAESEFVIQEALERLMEGRTTLVIAHRLSSVRTTDRLLVLRDGVLVESGSHGELLAAGGEYTRLMAEQSADAGEGMVAALEPPGDRVPEYERGDEHVASEEGQGAPTEAILQAEGMGWFEVFRVLLGLVRPWWGELGLSFTLGIGRFVSLIAVGILSALIVARVKDGEPFGGLMIGLGVTAPLTAVLHWAESWVSHDMAFRLLAEMRVDLFRKLDLLAPAYLFRRRTGDLVSMATQDVETIEYFFAHTIAPGFVAVVIPVGVLVTLGVSGWPLALALTPFLAAIALSPFLARGRIDRLGARSREELGLLNAHAVDTLQGLHEIAAFEREGARIAEFVSRARRYVEVRVPFFHELTLQGVYLEVATGLGGLGIAMVGAWLVIDGSLEAGQLPLLTLLALSAFLPVSEISAVGRLLADTLGSTRRVYAVHSERVVVADGPGVTGAGVGSGCGRLSVEDVEFSYEFANRPALSGVSFEVPPGSTVAVVGPSGAGKTTTAHLLLRFWDPSRGRLLMDGHDLREYSLDELRRRIALVAQDTYLFNGSLRANLLVARPEAGEAELEGAVEMAALGEFVGSLPEGLDTVVGERGAQLSGGQRQRVAIGRAFLKDAPILILDEATSHLDATNERLVREALNLLMEDRTTVVIAHRLSTVRDADAIVVLDEGRVVETGRHDELLRRGGLYSHLVARQLGGRGSGGAYPADSGEWAGAEAAAAAGGGSAGIRCAVSLSAGAAGAGRVLPVKSEERRE